MKKEFKNIILGSILLSLVMTGNMFVSNAFAENNDAVAAAAAYERMVRQYPSMVQYSEQAKRKIKNNWYPPTESFEHSATILLNIDKEGKLLNCSFITPSPDEGFNASLIEAANKAKFAPLPKEIKEQSVSINMSFEMKRRHVTK
jgi:TonB family protein